MGQVRASQLIVAVAPATLFVVATSVADAARANPTSPAALVERRWCDGSVWQCRDLKVVETFNKKLQREDSANGVVKRQNLWVEGLRMHVSDKKWNRLDQCVVSLTMDKGKVSLNLVSQTAFNNRRDCAQKDFGDWELER